MTMSTLYPPYVIERSSRGERSYDIFSRLLMDRIVFLGAPINDDVASLVRAQGGYITGWGGQQVPLMNSFFGGPTMVRGFAPNGFGPRDLTPGTTMDNVGGSMYWATTAELQSAIPGVPPAPG